MKVAVLPKTILTLCLTVALSFSMAISGVEARGTPDGFADLVENLTPAVVNISSSKSLGTNFQDNAQLRQFQDKLNNPAVSLGSGFIVDTAGIVVTNHHVVKDADEITVTLSDKREFDAVILGSDQETDIAVLQMQNASGLTAVDFGDSQRARVGEWVVAIGNPFGLGGSVSAGIISARNRDIDAGLYDDFIQTDAAINRGNSGGPLFNMSGDVIGVNTAIFSQTGGSVGVGFAIPADLAQTVVRQLVTYGETQRGWLGVSLEDLSKDRATDLGLPSEQGAYVAGVRANSPAFRGGIQENDFIIAYNGRKISEVRDLTRAVADTPVGKTVSVRVLRDGKPVTLRVKVDRRETNFAALGDFDSMAESLPLGAASTSGLVLQQPTSEVREAFGLTSDVQGVVVTAVDPDSPAGRVLQPGDVIIELGYEKIDNPFAMQSRMEKLRDLNSGPVQVYVRRGDRLFYELIKP